jgi:hypothetical protein
MRGQGGAKRILRPSKPLVLQKMSQNADILGLGSWSYCTNFSLNKNNNNILELERQRCCLIDAVPLITILLLFNIFTVPFVRYL